MLRVILLLILAFVFYIFLGRLLSYFQSMPGGGGTGGGSGGGRAKSVDGDEMVQDPECKVFFPLSRSVKREVGGRTLHFCSEDCAKKFIKNIP